MPSIYNIDYNQQAIELLPPDKRTTRMTKWVQSLLSPLQWIRDISLGTYRTGATAMAYSAGTYSIYDLVTYKKAVYVSLTDSNTSAPTDTLKWLRVQDNFIGINERILFNGQTIVIEYALNKWFSTTFRQPNSLSDIYILNETILTPFFRVGALESNSSVSFTQSSTEYVINDYSTAATPNFSINIPVSVYNALGSNNTDRDNTVRSFADKYIPSGLLYTIATY